MTQYMNFPHCFEMSLIDVGAAGGVHPRWGSLDNPNLRVLMIEPEAKAFDELDGDDQRIKVSPVALSNSKGSRTLYVAEKGMCSSFQKRNFEFVNLFPNSGRFAIISKEEVETETLDETVKSQNLPYIDFIKVDVEGHENFMIEAGQETLKQAIGIEAEMLFAPLFTDAATFVDQHQSFTDMGYSLYDLQRYYWRREAGKALPSKGQLVYCNGLYLKTPEKVMAEDGVDARRIKAALRIYASFELFDLVQELISMDAVKSMLSAEEIKTVQKYLSDFEMPNAGKTQSSFLHKVLIKLSTVLHKMAVKIEPTWQTRSYYASDNELGQRD